MSAPPLRPRSTRRSLVIFSLLTTGLIAVARVSAQTTVAVTGTSNIYGAGFGTAPDPGGGGGGVQPTLFAVPGGTTAVTFTGVTGGATFNANTDGAAPADGGTNFGAQTAITTFNSLSGLSYAGKTQFLVGVFLDASAPAGTAPATVSYDNTSAGAASFSPALQQVFFIGDGLDATFGPQLFNVPTGATRLYLGFADAWNGSSVTGLPGSYIDNGGTLSATITAIPEPTPVSLLCGLGVLGAAAVRRRPRARAMAAH